MLTIHNIHRRDVYLLVLILFIAGLMRFGEAHIVEFFHDDAMLSTLAQEMAAGETFPLTGILSSVGIPNPPISVYVVAIPFKISYHPMTAILFIMGWNVIGVGLLWLITHRYFGRTTALIAGMAYALSPWAIVYSRKIWAQDFHTPFILLAILFGLLGFAEGGTEKKHQLTRMLCLPILLFGIQIHFAAWFLLPIYCVFLWIGRKNPSRKVLMVSAVLAIFVLMPYMVGLYQTLLDDPTRITDAVSRSDASSGFALSVDSMRYTLYLTTGLGLESWLTPNNPTDFLASVPTVGPIWLLFGLLAIAGIYAVRNNRLLVLLFACWIGIPIAVFLPNWTPVYGHYFIASIPALMCLIGIGANHFIVSLPHAPHSRTVTLSLIGALLLSQGLWWRATLRYLDTHEIPYPGFTTPLHYLEDVRAELAQYEDVVIISHGMWWLLHHESAVWPVMLRDSTRCTRTLKGDGYAVLPNHPFAILIAPDAPPNPVVNFYQSNDVTDIAVRPNGGEYVIYAFDEAPEWTLSNIAPIEPVTFDGSVQLTGYALEDNRLTLRWSLPARNPNISYQYSGQLLNAEGERIAQQDTVFWYGRHWCEGDTLITWTDIEIPEDGTTLRVSLYTLGTGKNTGQYFSANILDVAGNPAGQWLDIPLTP